MRLRVCFKNNRICISVLYSSKLASSLLLLLVVVDRIEMVGE